MTLSPPLFLPQRRKWVAPPTDTTPVLRRQAYRSLERAQQWSIQLDQAYERFNALSREQRASAQGQEIAALLSRATRERNEIQSFINAWAHRAQVLGYLDSEGNPLVEPPPEDLSGLGAFVAVAVIAVAVLLLIVYMGNQNEVRALINTVTQFGTTVVDLVRKFTGLSPLPKFDYKPTPSLQEQFQEAASTFADTLATPILIGLGLIVFAQVMGGRR